MKKEIYYPQQAFELDSYDDWYKDAKLLKGRIYVATKESGVLHIDKLTALVEVQKGESEVQTILRLVGELTWRLEIWRASSDRRPTYIRYNDIYYRFYASGGLIPEFQANTVREFKIVYPEGEQQYQLQGGND